MTAPTEPVQPRDRDAVDLAGDSSFPASDPPSWWSGRDPDQAPPPAESPDR
jgi:hypothetical protein